MNPDEEVVLGEHLKLLERMFDKLHRKEADIAISGANECLKNTPFMFFLTGDGVKVVLREQMVALSKFLFDKDCFVEGR